MAAMTYPPGVLTGRPMEMFEASPTLDLYATPEQWSSSEDQGILRELCDALDTKGQGEMDWIQTQLGLLERYQDQTAFYKYPMVHEDGGVLTLFDFSSFGLQDALRQFEEDFDYEDSLQMEQLKNTEVNFHRLLATPPSDRTGWCGESGYNPGSRGCYELLNTERYRFEAKVIHNFPSDRQGYALAETVYGKIYIPEKFRGFVPPLGESIDVTVALQDVSPKMNGRPHSFRFSAIYLH